MDKPTLRRLMRERLATLKPLQRAQEEELVNAAIISDPDWQAAGTVLVFRAIRHEISVVSATNDALRSGKRVCFPRVAIGGLSLHEVSDWSQLQPGAYGVPEPAETAPVVSPATVDLALVPGVAFTPDGHRLGQGGGYYDRLLPMLGGASWGVCFASQIAEELPRETHDRPVDRVIWPGAVQ